MRNCYVIAEAGVNHNGDVALAKEMIHVAKEAGADAVKFQLFKAQALTTKAAQQADYQKKNCQRESSQFDMLKALELSYEAFQRLHQEAITADIDFMITPFDLESLEFIISVLQLPIIKVGSGDITFGPLLLRAARSESRIILSTGMATLDEIKQALQVIAFGAMEKSAFPTQERVTAAYLSAEGQSLLRERVSLLHCVSEYPAPYHDMNLRAMKTLATEFQLNIGLSDHSEGIVVPIAAVAMGANIIEKHFTLDKNLEGPDHKASIDPKELIEMMKAIRIVEQSLGDGEKSVRASELKNKALVRRSLVAKQAIAAGELFTLQNIDMKRPGEGVSPMQLWEWLDRKATRAYSEDEVLSCK